MVAMAGIVRGGRPRPPQRFDTHFLITPASHNIRIAGFVNGFSQGTFSAAAPGAAVLPEWLGQGGADLMAV